MKTTKASLLVLQDDFGHYLSSYQAQMITLICTLMQAIINGVHAGVSFAFKLMFISRMIRQ